VPAALEPPPPVVPPAPPLPLLPQAASVSEMRSPRIVLLGVVVVVVVVVGVEVVVVVAVGVEVVVGVVVGVALVIYPNTRIHNQMRKSPMVRLTIRVPKDNLKKLDQLHRKFWPTDTPRRGRGRVIRIIIRQYWKASLK
jgi:hypothetical protein